MEFEIVEFDEELGKKNLEESDCSGSKKGGKGVDREEAGDVQTVNN